MTDESKVKSSSPKRVPPLRRELATLFLEHMARLNQREKQGKRPVQIGT
jgi:hypothetical protein